MTNWNQWLVVIPARLQSTRLPEKPLQDLKGKPLVVRVYERLLPLKEKGAHLVVATDSSKVMDACKDFGVQSMMTLESHESGTDRVQEIAAKLNYDFILNVQGDEPFVDLQDLEKLTHSMEKHQKPEMGTLVYRNKSQQDFENPNIVKAVIGDNGSALYFSRASIPFDRSQSFDGFWHHQGIYCYSRKTLDTFCNLPVHHLENTEKLEQLRALGHGIDILTVEAQKPSIGIDTPQDLEDAREHY